MSKSYSTSVCIVLLTMTPHTRTANYQQTSYRDRLTTNMIIITRYEVEASQSHIGVDIFNYKVKTARILHVKSYPREGRIIHAVYLLYMHGV